MRTPLWNLVSIILIAGMIQACASKSKNEKGAESAPPTQAATEEPKPARESSEPQSARKEVPVDPKYKPLTQALRSPSAKPGAVQDEAAKILGASPNDPVALNTIALLHLRKNRPSAAKLLILRALEKNPPEAAGLHNNLGVALLDEGDRDGAVAQFKKALQLDDRHAEAHGNLGSIYSQAGNHSKALSHLAVAYKQLKFNSQVANNYAVALRVSGDLEGARKVYEEAVKQNSKDVNTHLNYAILLIDFMNKPKDGLDLVYKVKFLETQRKDVLSRANALEKKAKTELK